MKSNNDKMNPIFDQIIEKYQKGQKAKEISESLNKPIANIYNYISRARREGFLENRAKKDRLERAPRRKRTAMITLPAAESSRIMIVIADFETTQKLIEGWT